jgi:TRAP-type C4-dicarboxylate transport system permease small subunit
LIERLTRGLRLVESGALAALLATMIGLAAYQVIARNLFDSGVMWGDGLVRVLVLWVTLLGGMVASRYDEHIRMDLAGRFLSVRGDRLRQRLTSAFTAAICGLFAWHSARFVWLDYQDGVTAFAAVPAWVCESIMPFGATVMCLRYLLHVFDPPQAPPEPGLTLPGLPPTTGQTPR